MRALRYTALAQKSARALHVSPLTQSVRVRAQTVLANLSVYALICNSIVCWRHMIKYMYKHGTNVFFKKLLFTIFKKCTCRQYKPITKIKGLLRILKENQV